MRTVVTEPAEDQMRLIANQLGISVNDLNNILLEILLVNVFYDEMMRIVKLTINKAVKDKGESQK